ncbi:hypothetical protein [Thiobaca trueperi]|uniref:hypothetical protein n=1 Tax=Thiobaca trueperi TaxID=127458 RepID=UPI0010526936|nr:hypothetical protein [Thiobaca trueperi]
MTILIRIFAFVCPTAPPDPVRNVEALIDLHHARIYPHPDLLGWLAKGLEKWGVSLDEILGLRVPSRRAGSKTLKQNKLEAFWIKTMFYIYII